MPAGPTVFHGTDLGTLNAAPESLAAVHIPQHITLLDLDLATRHELRPGEWARGRSRELAVWADATFSPIHPPMAVCVSEPCFPRLASQGAPRS